MPLTLRTVEPKYLSRQVVTVRDNELEAVTNNTLANVLRQLASLVLLASEIFEGLAEGLQGIHERSVSLRAAIDRVDQKVAEHNPKTVTVPESDICSFSQRTVHFHAPQKIDSALFTVSSRPDTIRRLYEAAAPTPVRTIRALDQFRRDGTRSSKLFICTPVLHGKRKRWRKVDLDIETRKPSVVEDLRKWTSSEALGDVTVQPDNTIVVDKQEVPVDHLLPSPEEQMMAVAMKFPPCIVPVDVSGKAFDRLSTTRRSWNNIQTVAEPGARRRKGKRRDKRRNTLAGTSHKEIEQAMAGETTTEAEGIEFEPLAPLRAGSGELFKVKGTAADQIKSQLSSLKQWSRGKLRAALVRQNPELSTSRPSFFASDVVDDDIVVYGRVAVQRGGSSTSMETTTASNIVVRLRENSLQRRNRRAGVAKTKDEPAHSSSGNWSASSDRTSIASETTTAPKSTSSATSTNSLHHAPPSTQSRRRILASGSSSVSEGTLTPDIQEFDGETSSVYSCDTEGYYTSFHVDSGLKTLKEEDIGLSSSSLRLDMSSNFPNFQPTKAQLTAENEYELFGKGSTSTTTSSAGTVCTTLMAGHTLGSRQSLSGFAPPAVPERKSSLDRKERTILVADSPSPDSGHNTSSSPGDSCGQVESDLEGERVERLRNKTAITTGRIPSMVAITPPVSDEEVGPQAPLRIAIPDVYALPDKRKREVKTISNNGILETNLDYVEDRNCRPKHYTVEREVIVPSTIVNCERLQVSTERRPSIKNSSSVENHSSKPLESDNSSEYVSLNSIPSNDSLERRRQGARVSLDSDGKVVYSSDSLKRRKDHSTFVPGKHVRESPTPSPVLDLRTPKTVRPVHTSGLIRTNADVTDSVTRSASPKRDTRRSTSPKIDRSISPKDDRKSPRLGKVFVRSATRVVSPVTTKRSPSNTLDHPKRNIQNLDHPSRVSDEEKKKMLRSNILGSERKGLFLPLEGIRSASPALSNSSKRSADYEEGSKNRWISKHPSASIEEASAKQAASIPPFPRNHPMYWTLPGKKSSPEFARKFSTPTKTTNKGLDLTLSPITSPKTTMTSEELFTAIHRSKKRLNLKNDEVKKPELAPTTSPRTSLQNFKILLLQKSARDTGKLSAVERLKLSKDSGRFSPEVKNQTPPKNVWKNQWKFSSPRSNVLSSTIQEDSAEIERTEKHLPNEERVEDRIIQKQFVRQLESSPSLKRAREDFTSVKPPRASPIPDGSIGESDYSKCNGSTNHYEEISSLPYQMRRLPGTPPYTDSLGRAPRRLISNTYAKITAPLQRPVRNLETDRLSQSSRNEESFSVRKSLDTARKEFFEGSPPTPVPFTHRVSPENIVNLKNGRVSVSPHSSALISPSKRNVRSPNVSLETAL